MKKILLISISLLLLTIEHSFCADKNSVDENAVKIDDIPKNYIGAAISSISSFGISYHKIYGKYLESTNAYKFTFLILPDSYDDNVWIFAGFELQSNIYINNFSRFYWLFGGSYQSLYLTCGPAIGYELFSGINGIAINLDLGFAFMLAIPNPHASGPEGSISLAPGIGLGISYAY
jgi:hypothetical protein